MEIIRDIKSGMGDGKGSVVALGNFDGLHLGHRAIIAGGQEIAKLTNSQFAIMSFEPHPRVFLSKEPSRNLRIYSLYNKLLTIKILGVDMVFLMRFNEEFASLSAEDFISKILLEKLGVRHVITGEDFCFGKGRRGDKNMLANFAEKLGFGYSVQPKICSEGGEVVSSSSIRKLLEQGDVKNAGRLLGQAYHIAGRVKHGEGRGQKIGFPTANISLSKLFMPRFGVYAVRVCISGDDKVYNAVANIGVKPTFGVFAPQLEVYIFDFAQDIYGKHMCVEFVDFIRAEQKFADINALIAQIAKDAQTAKAILGLA